MPTVRNTRPLPRQNAPMPLRGRGAPAASSVPHSLWIGSLFFVIVVFFRPQDLVPGLSSLKLGALASIWLAIAWFSNQQKDHLSDVLPKLYLAFLVLLTASVVVARNHYWYLVCVQEMAVLGVAFYLVLPAILREREKRTSYLRWLLTSFVFVAFWAVTHGGKGTSSFMSDENDTAAALCVALSLCFWMWRYDPGRAWRLLGLAGMGLCVAGVVIGGSRGGFIGLAATVFTIAFLTGKLVRSLIAVAVIAVLSVPFLPDGYIDEMRTIQDSNDGTRNERIYSWNRAMDLFWKSPLIGVGANQYPWRLPDVENTKEAIKERGEKHQNRMVGGRAAHSLYFTLIPETGVIGVGIFVALVWHSFRRAWYWHTADAPKDDDRRKLAYFVLSGGAGMLVASLFISTLYYPWVWLFAAMSIVLDPRVTSDEAGRLSWPGPVRRARTPAPAPGTPE